METQQLHIDPEVLKKAKRWRTTLWVSIFGTVAPLILGFGGTVVSMLMAFNKLSSGKGGTPEEFAGFIGASLISTAVSLPITVIFLVLLIISIVALKRLKRESTK